MGARLTDEELLARLVSFPTVSTAGNRACADFVSDYLLGSGVDLVRIESDNGRKVNLIARTGRANTSKAEQGLTLCGHLDVVPASEAGWISEPFSLRVTDEAYVARGACDMKGFVALAINTVKRAASKPLRHPLALLLTYDEEVGSLGAWQLVREWDRVRPLPKCTIVGEPTSLRVVRMHKGHLKLRITLDGVSAHSGYPELGVNAIEPAGRIIVALTGLKEAWRLRRHDTSWFFPESPYVTLNVALIHGGTAVNIVPDNCVIDLGVRPLPNMNADELAEEVRGAILSAVAFDACRVEVTHDNPALCTDENEPGYRRLCALSGQSDTVGVSYASDAGVLAQRGLECVLWGPGDIAVAHKPNECLTRKDLLAAGRQLNDMVRAWCA